MDKIKQHFSIRRVYVKIHLPCPTYIACTSNIDTENCKDTPSLPCIYSAYAILQSTAFLSDLWETSVQSARRKAVDLGYVIQVNVPRSQLSFNNIYKNVKIEEKIKQTTTGHARPV